jgi:alkylated DNA repair dioxygenase AlkB
MLFDPVRPRLPSGILYVPNFITEELENALTKHLDSGNWSNDLKRRVQHFGYRYDYKARRVTFESHLGPLPEWLQPVAQTLLMSGYTRKTPDQVIANEYLPGQGISAHIDCEPCFGPVVASLSLLSHCEMVFRSIDRSAKVSIILEPRSLVILSGDGRYSWTHEIPARKSDMIKGQRHPRDRRISLTFREMLLND